jgi:hypothetical protein
MANHRAPDRAAYCFSVLIVATAIAVFSAHPYAGGWNDGSRLATIESLVDYHTLAIDRSIFVQVPAESSPYPPAETGLQRYGTGDKLWIDGHFYSDKSPVPALLMAGQYQILQWFTGLTARAHPDIFCYWMTLLSSGLAYVIAVGCIYQLGGPLRLPLPLRLALTASFGLCTVALPYVRHVNNHIVLLAATAALMLGFARLAEEVRTGSVRWPRLLLLGMLAGLGYSIDLGAGPVLLLCSLALIFYRCRQIGSVILFGLAAFPWLALHHAVNYATGGTWKPANAVPEYFLWPGCTFNPQNLTGSWNHANIGHFLTYAAALLVGKRGFLGHNLPLFLVLPGVVILLRRRLAELPEVLFALAWCGGSWLAYALTSNNYSGLCCSIRWFVPFLAPGYYVLALLLRQDGRIQQVGRISNPSQQQVGRISNPSHGVMLILSCWGAVLAAIMWWHGPWIQHLVPWFWPLQGAALLSVIAYGIQQRRAGRHSTPALAPPPDAPAGAAALPAVGPRTSAGGLAWPPRMAASLPPPGLR